VCDEIVCTIDLPRSLAALAGKPAAVGTFPDSQDLRGVLIGEADARGRESLVQQDNGRSGRFGYRSGRWKLVRQPAGEKQVRPRIARDSLYDLESDPGEATDVRAKFPEVARRLGGELDAATRPRDPAAAPAPRDAGARRLQEVARATISEGEPSGAAR
jgi:arylsulfatase A